MPEIILPLTNNPTATDFAVVPALTLADNATSAFKISDVRQNASEFIQQMSSLVLQDVEATADDIDIADLKLKSEEAEFIELQQEIHQTGATAALQSMQGANEDEESLSEADDEEQQPTETEQGDNANGAGTSSTAGYLALDRLAAQQIFVEMADTVKLRRQRRREAAAARLSSLQPQQETAAQKKKKASGQPGLAWEQHKRNKHLTMLKEAVSKPETAEDAISSDEIIIHVAVYMPEAPSHVSEEWLVLGSQPLTALRDALYCLTEANLKAVDAQENINKRGENDEAYVPYCKPSAYFYIEGTFYNDMRSPDALDYSAPIRSYLAQHNAPAPPHPLPGDDSSRKHRHMTTEFTVANMEETVFEDVWVRLGSGAPALFCHQGYCEHLVVFKDVRMYAPGADPPAREQYPFRIAADSRLAVFKRCEVCDNRVAKKVTYKDQQAPHSPYFWCDECYTLMHYDENNTVRYTDYQVFPYHHELHPSTTISGRQKGHKTRF